ncbi:transmembrane signal receptor [Lithospermum erythrorhizon]|uniref:Transmembrane signal receptor n=1 Tax=Lithospermum erythrorhizon TaxID=34254 RepID=A0AAV3Q9E3_LITER
MTSTESIFENIDKSIKSQVRLGNGELIPVGGKGTIAVQRQKDIHYNETFASVARFDTIRALVTLAAQKRWKIQIHQLDMKLAFLNGFLEEDINVNEPQGFVVKGCEGKVLKLKKTLYGLKQAPRAWYSRIDSYFINQRFRRSESEPTIYIKTQGQSNTLIVSLYVDDLIFTGNNEKMIQKFKETIMRTFEISDHSLMHYFLGMKIAQSEEGIFLFQKKYRENLLKKFGMYGCKRVTTPLVTNEKYKKEDG